MRSQMAAAVGRLAGLGCRHSSMSADTTAGPSSGTSMSLRRRARHIKYAVTSHNRWSQDRTHVGKHDQSAAVMQTRTIDIECQSQVQQEIDGSNRNPPELASYGHLVRADFPAAEQGPGDEAETLQHSVCSQQQLGHEMQC
jgi:hypothetical protein